MKSASRNRQNEMPCQIWDSYHAKHTPDARYPL
jgi:hypothetical protein